MTAAEVDQNFNALAQALDFQDEDRIPVLPLWFLAIGWVVYAGGLVFLLAGLAWLVVSGLSGA